MDIVIVAGNEDVLRRIVLDVTNTVVDANIETFVDPLMALKYLYSHKVKIIFLSHGLKHISADEFREVVNKFYSDVEVSIINEKETF